MKTLSSRLIVAALCCAAPAEAQEIRASVHAGLDRPLAKGDGSTGAVVGATLGIEQDGQGAFGGIEVGFDESSVKDCETDLVLPGDRGCLSVGRDLSAVARIGVRAGATSRAHLLVGYTNLRAKLAYELGSASERESQTFDGIRVGAGGEIGLASNAFLKAEYRYAN